MRTPRLRPLLAIAVPALPAAVLAWVVAAAALTSAHAWTGVHAVTGNAYDDGVYLGASVRLLHGALPWVDYDLLHPPGIVWIGLPFAALGELTHASWGLAAARVVTVLVAGINVVLAGLAVRSRGRIAVFTAATAFALMPTSYAATQTLLLEPYLVLFSLAGLVLLGTRDGGLAVGRRLFLAGALVGVATSVKVFGVLVACGVLIALVPRWRALRTWALGVAAGFLAVTLPFAVAAPGRFVLDVVVVQLRRSDLEQGLTLRERLPVILGLDTTAGGDDRRALWLLAIVLAVVVAGATIEVRRRRLTPVHVIALVTAVVVGAGMLLPRQFADHYAYFLVAIAVLPLGLGTAALVDALAERLRRGRETRPAWPAVSVVCLALVAAVLLVPGAAGRSRAYSAVSVDPGPLIRSYVPSGACVVTDLTSLLLVADRLDAPRSCAGPIDAYAVWFADNDFVSPHTATTFSPRLVERWSAWLRSADYAVLYAEYTNFIPWTPTLRAWFDTHYALVASGPMTHIYLRLPID